MLLQLQTTAVIFTTMPPVFEVGSRALTASSVNTHHNAVPLVPVEALADSHAGRVVAKHVHHLQLALLHDDVERVRVELDTGRGLHVVIHQQSVRQSGAELE